jgi:hypothetical protein
MVIKPPLKAVLMRCLLACLVLALATLPAWVRAAASPLT